MNWAAGICCHCREKNAFSRSRFPACRGAKTASGQSRQTHGLAGHGWPFGPCSPDSWSAQGRGEHVPFPADELGDHAVVQAERAGQLRVLACQGGGVLPGQDGWRVRPPDQVMLGVGNDGVDGLLLRRGGGGQVVVALDLREWLGSIVARPRPAQALLSRRDRCVVLMRDRWIFSGPPSSLVTSCRSIQRWIPTRSAFLMSMSAPGWLMPSHSRSRSAGPA